MRRFILPSLLLTAASICVLALSSPAGAARAFVCAQQERPSIVPCCPIPTTAPTNSPDVVSCCPIAIPCCPGAIPCCPGAIPCCPGANTCCPGANTCCPGANACCGGTLCCTPTPCAPGGVLTIASSPDPSVAGHRVVISGGLTSNPTAGDQALLWRELAGQASFHQVAQTTTDSAGQYRFTLKRGTVNADQRWYVTAAGRQSPTLDQTVSALVGLAGSRSATAGRATLLRGHVTPSHAGQVVLIEQRRGGKWVVIARPRLGHASNYGAMHTFARAGTAELRTVLPGDARNNRSSSPVLTVSIKD